MYMAAVGVKGLNSCLQLAIFTQAVQSDDVTGRLQEPAKDISPPPSAQSRRNPFSV